MNLPFHIRDEDCTLGADDCCITCGVFHGDACAECQGRGFHKPTCSELDGVVTLPAPPCESEAWLDFQVKRQDRIEGAYEAARKALKLARKFAGEVLVEGIDPRDDHRVRGCIQQVRAYRHQIARLRAMKWSDVDTVLVVALPDLSEVA